MPPSRREIWIDTRWQNSGDLHGGSAQLYLPAHRRWIGPVASLPQLVRDEDRIEILGTERAAKRRLNSKKGEVARADPPHADLLGFRVSEE